MDYISIQGPCKLKGEVKTSGAKNAALPLIAATLLAETPITLTSVPQLKDVSTILGVVESLGAKVSYKEDGVATVEMTELKNHHAPDDLVQAMRASILVLGPLLARFGKAKVSLPGGCAIGARPIDALLDGMRALGAIVNVTDTHVEAYTEGKLQGGEITFKKVAVTGTENLLMAAVLAEGTTVMHNAAREPEIVDLANMLNAMGAKITGAGTSTIKVEGVESLQGVTYKVLSDRIEAGTYMIAAAMAAEEPVRITNTDPKDNPTLIAYLKEAGVDIKVNEQEHWVEIAKRPDVLKPIDVVTEPFPGFATDLQAQMMAFLTAVEGTSTITETVYENRFMHVAQMNKLGTNISYEGSVATIVGAHTLQGAEVEATDLRAAAALVLMGLVTSGETRVTNLKHIDRGYENLEQKFKNLGARITRVYVEDKKYA